MRKGKRPSCDEAVSSMKVMVDGKKWIVLEIDIVHEPWPECVKMVIANGHHRQRYIVQRSGVTKSWIALKKDVMKYDHLLIQINDKRWDAVDISQVFRGDEEWIHIDISNERGSRHFVEVEIGGTITAFHALLPKIDREILMADVAEALSQL